MWRRCTWPWEPPSFLLAQIEPAQDESVVRDGDGDEQAGGGNKVEPFVDGEVADDSRAIRPAILGRRVSHLAQAAHGEQTGFAAGGVNGSLDSPARRGWPLA